MQYRYTASRISIVISLRSEFQKQKFHKFVTATTILLEGKLTQTGQLMLLDSPTAELEVIAAATWEVLGKNPINSVFAIKIPVKYISPSYVNSYLHSGYNSILTGVAVIIFIGSFKV